MTLPSSQLRTLDFAYIALFAVLITISAWISIPFVVPFTLQTFAVFLVLMTLGGKRGFYAILVYLLMGVVGFPVFSGFQGGLGVLMGASGGYLSGFLVLALLFWGITASGNPSSFRTVIAALIGLLACYIVGTIWFSVGYAVASSGDILSTMTVCVLPYAIPDLIKLALAFTISRRLKQFLK